MIPGQDIIRVAGIQKESIVDGPGIRYVVFAQGCPHRCKGCQNGETHDFSAGYDLPIEKIAEDTLKNPMLSGVTFSGGEPFSQPVGFYRLALLLAGRGLDIIAFSGYTYEELLVLAESDPSVRDLLGAVDFLVDGRFELENRDLTLDFKGSSNQRFIDMERTRAEGRVVVV